MSARNRRMLRDRTMWAASSMIIRAFVVAAGISLGLSACADCENSSDCELGKVCASGECVSPSDADTDTDADTDVDTDADTDSDTDTDTDADSDTDTDTDTPTTCEDPEEDCPEPANECSYYTCVDELCELQYDNGIACTGDANECTSDLCVDGVCTPFPLSGIACASDGESCTNDLCTEGVCEHLAIGDGAACAADGNPCTDDVCQDGICGVPLPWADCVADDNPCTIDYCDAEGDCVIDQVTDSTPCDDGIWCNGGADRCYDGVCTPATGAVPCVADNGCQEVDCTEPDGETPGDCEVVDLDDTSCDDGAFCNGADTCDNGECIHPTPACGAGSTQCSYELCDEGIDDCYFADASDGTSCSLDSLQCNGLESCDDGECVHGAAFCEVFADCSTRECFENDGDPYCGDFVAVDDGTPCTQSDVCAGTGTQLCVGGVCAEGENPVCVPQDHDGNLCTRFIACFEDSGFPNCFIETSSTTFDTIGCPDTDETGVRSFDTAPANNDVDTYSSPACAGAFTGGEQAFGITVDAGTSYTVTIESTATTLDDDLYMLLVTDPCNAAGTCLQVSDTSMSLVAPSSGTHYIVIDGVSGNRGSGTITVTCP